MKNYSERVDKIFGIDLYKHRTLRTIFDPYSSEWEETTIEKKLEILKTIIESGEDLVRIIREYKIFYIELKKPDVAKDASSGLAVLLSYTLKN